MKLKILFLYDYRSDKSVLFTIRRSHICFSVLISGKIKFLWFFFYWPFLRSLVALSLILSMLLFKPAPIYILDEVDAALDLSHTQNIGQMLRTHFTHSQFIVVSLKEGMFNNANVLFKTKFVDGVSTVARFTQCQNGKISKEAKSKAKPPKGAHVEV